MEHLIELKDVYKIYQMGEEMPSRAWTVSYTAWYIYTLGTPLLSPACMWL